MEQLLLYIKNLNLNWQSLGITAVVLTLGCLLTGTLSRAVFGKRSVLFESASSAIGIIFIYALTAVIYSIGTQYIPYTSPLPFAIITSEELTLVKMTGMHYTQLCGILLSMVILSFIMNITDRWLPKGKHFLVWVFWRCVTVIGSMFLHLVVVGLMHKYLPEGILIYAPTILLCLLGIMILTGALKIIVGVILTTVNPLIGALYTLFFANIIGRQVTKAVFTTGIVTGLFYLLEKLQVAAISILPGALIAYIPFAIVLLVCWYGIKKLA